MERNYVETPIIPDSPKVVPNEVVHVYVPMAGYDTKGAASFNDLHFIVENGKVSIEPQIIDNINKNSNVKTYLEGNGGTLDLEVKDGAIYHISGYNFINISVPSGVDYTSHLFVSFADNGQAVGFQFPEGMKVYGANPNMADGGDSWEVNVDNVGGALCMKKEVVS